MPEIISGLPFILLAVLQLSMSERRIKGGQDITADKTFAVYLLRSPDAPVRTFGWTCGGTIVSRSFVVTAASCVNDLQKVYVIAGYKKFVTSTQIDKDACTSKTKRKVILICVPKEYQLNYEATEEWARVDIALLKVDTPFDVSNKIYAKHCSYIPTSIDINYWPKNQEPGVDALTMGWGHVGQHKDDLDVHNYNVDSIKYTPTKILEKKKCLSHFPYNKKMHPIIKKYMICTLDPGNLDDNGRIILKSPYTEGCITRKEKLMGMIGRMCEKEEAVIDARKDLANTSNTTIDAMKDPNNINYNTTYKRIENNMSNETIGIRKDLTIYPRKELISQKITTNKAIKDTNNLNPIIDTKTDPNNLKNTSLDSFKDPNYQYNALEENKNELANVINVTKANKCQRFLKITTIASRNELTNLSNKEIVVIEDPGIDPGNVTLEILRDLTHDGPIDGRKGVKNQSKPTIDASTNLTNLSNSTMEAKKVLNNSRKYENNRDKNTQSLPANETTSNLPPLPEDIKIDTETLRIANDNKKAKEAPGICQNDHGGPLVTWEGKHVILIGVATLYKVDDALNCMGPYLFTSTYCTGAFLECILSLENDTDTSRRCENSEKQPFEIIQRRISWNENDEGDIKKEVKEIVRLRPQIPLSAFYFRI